MQKAALRELLPPGIVYRLAAVENVACRLPVRCCACWPFVCPSFLLPRLPRCFDPTCVTPAPQDPHSLPEGSEPCVVLSQIGDLPGYKCSGNPKFVRDYLHAASPATAGASAGATAGATAGGAADATASSGGALAKAGGPQGSGRQQSQQQQQQPTKHLVDVIAEQLEDECYAQLICKSCEVGAGEPGSLKPWCTASIGSAQCFTV